METEEFFKCDICERKSKNAGRYYVRCLKNGNVKKRIECKDYVDPKSLNKPVTKIGFAEAAERGLV